MEQLSNLKSKVQELMLEKDDSMEDIEKWPSKYESGVWENDSQKEELQSRIKELKDRENEERRAEEDQIKKSAFN